ncbi:Carbonic anhydrase [Seminavis robusta]|uniref:Carbonic anhydrase n=1 Tax=Seminavis robusta TaxID=568900 RepID=A0A9N8EIX2_9STRA|nr:Carbonic anhydrase [Seminavis robusta]|eukprot:Sro1071_g237870.1 Carbonic anhydrase (335) ;mRNA; f:7549-8740
MRVSFSALVTLFLGTTSLLPQAAKATEPVVFDYMDPDSDWPLFSTIPTSFGDMPNECGMTERQSPIDIPTSVIRSLCERPTTPYFIDGRNTGKCEFSALSFPIRDVDVGVDLNGCTTMPSIKLDNGPNGDGANYTALQFHIHTGTEHSFNTDFEDAELHIVHANMNVGDFTYETGDFQVLGVKIRGGDGARPNYRFERLLVEWEESLAQTEASCSGELTVGDSTTVVGRSQSRPTGSFNPYDLIPVGTDFYTYEGSLTAPPCSQTVMWNLATEFMRVSRSQLLRLYNVINNYKYPMGSSAACQFNAKPDIEGSTSRPPQPLNGRIVKRTCGGIE